MPKKIEDVVTPERRRSIRNIPIPEGRKKSFAARLNEEAALPPNPPANGRNGAPGNRSRKGLWIAIGVAAVVIIFAALSLFEGGTLTYVPKTAAFTLESEAYEAHKNGEGNLVFSVVKLSGDKGVVVNATGEEEVNRKASGQIVVYNNASAEPQRLIATTRFEAANGKVYRIKDAIVVPGKKTVGGVSQAGSIEVTVYADETGDSYNQGLTDFTLPGLKGTSRFETIYARSHTPMSGGFVGKEKVASNEDLTKAKAVLEAALKGELLETAKAQVPADFILFPSLSSVTFEDLPQSGATKDSVKINIRGYLHGVVFKRTDLARHLAAERVTVGPNETVEIEDLSTLTVSFLGLPPPDLLKSDKISFEASGNAALTWKIDESALKRDLAGVNKRSISQVLRNYPAVVSADAVVRPFWKNTFPDNPAKIRVVKTTTP